MTDEKHQSQHELVDKRLEHQRKKAQIRLVTIQGFVVIGWFSLLGLLIIFIAPAETGIVDCLWLLVCIVMVVRGVKMCK